MIYTNRLKKSSILVVLVIGLFLLSVFSFMVPKISAATQAELCTAAGGVPRYLQDGSTTGTGEYAYSYCECPDNKVFFDNACVTGSELITQYCRDEGGQPRLRPDPSTNEYSFSYCECPNERVFVKNKCITVTDLKTLNCRDSGGQPNLVQDGNRTGEYNFIGCTCPSNLEYRNGACREKEVTEDEQADVGFQPSYIANDCDASDGQINEENCGIIRYLVLFINTLAALAGLVIVGSIIYGGIQYSTAGSDPQKISAAKDRIRNALFALMFFIFGYSFLNYLVPGGVL